MKRNEKGGLKRARGKGRESHGALKKWVRAERTQKKEKEAKGGEEGNKGGVEYAQRRDVFEGEEQRIGGRAIGGGNRRGGTRRGGMSKIGIGLQGANCKKGETEVRGGGGNSTVLKRETKN